ncbi:ATP-binding protein [Enterovirga rhinocerotis]|uniref:histidine kinase n=1 Tax=Enterovirga rhinocerotis TaxID=1339210 RepID=A0A4R7BKX0_9HYPH|nr:ATP-binding protein [Enterovirga rhinocerotis]TDR85242.1 phospho-acceptor domain-containing protein [Enterovirga rhinocerotis]
MWLGHTVKVDRAERVSTETADRSQVRRAVLLLAGLLVVLLMVAPIARQPLSGTEPLLPAYAAAIFVSEMVTVALLLALFGVQRSWALLALAGGYLFSGLTVIPWAFTFPDVFPGWAVGDGLQTTASIAAFRRLGFPLFVLAYALLRDRPPVHGSASWPIAGVIAGVTGVALGATGLIIVGDDVLPRFMTDKRNVAAVWFVVPPATIVLYACGLGLLLRRPLSVLDLWLVVVLCTLLIELVLLSYVSAGLRLGVGWWVGRACGLLSATIMLLVLLLETTSLYARLARSVAAERRGRNNRITTMEVLSASIAHEVKQPLASMVTNADAGLRWLAKEPPRSDEAKAALGRIVRDGHRASRVIESVRAMYTKGSQERVAVDLNARIEEVVEAYESEFRLSGISVETDLEPMLPLVLGNPAQLHQVACNLIDNAVEAMRPVAGRRRLLRATSRRRSDGEVVVSIEDTGTGLDPAHGEDIFEPFFTTKPDGMGMGLMFCRSVVEAHGGRLWASANIPHGAVLTFSLPEAGEEG